MNARLGRRQSLWAQTSLILASQWKEWAKPAEHPVHAAFPDHGTHHTDPSPPYTCALPWRLGCNVTPQSGTPPPRRPVTYLKDNTTVSTSPSCSQALSSGALTPVGPAPQTLKGFNCPNVSWAVRPNHKWADFQTRSLSRRGSHRGLPSHPVGLWPSARLRDSQHPFLPVGVERG